MLTLDHRYPLLNLVAGDEREAWLSQGRSTQLAAGETLFREGTFGAWAYLLEEGQVRLLRSGTGGDVTLGVFQSGDLFGEYALVPPHRNTATCRAMQPSRVVRLPLLPLRTTLLQQRDVWRTIKRWLRLHALTAYLRQRTFMGFMSAPTALEYLKDLVPVSFEPDQSIQGDGLADDRWFYIEEGQVTLTSSDGVAQLGPGACFGERALLGRRRLDVATASRATRCQELCRPAFLPADLSAPPTEQTRPAFEQPISYPWVGQEGFSDCGIAALAMLALCLGRSIDPADMRQRLRPQAGGLTLSELQTEGNRLGLQLRAVKIAMSQLSQVHLPAISLLHGNHYVTLFQVAPTSILVGDPATALTRWSHAMFQDIFSGHVVVCAS